MTRAGLYLYLEPLATPALAVPLLDEPFGPFVALGGGLVLAGVYEGQREATLVRPEYRSFYDTVLDMKRISIQDLKAQLSAAVAEAESGRTIVVTRHNEPVAQLGPAYPAQVHRGARVGTGRLEPAVKRGTKGRYLAVLMDDRGSR